MKHLLLISFLTLLTACGGGGGGGSTPIVDTDSDGIADDKDNCATIANPTQMDTDNDGQGNVCDNDIDGDGIPNEQETALGTNPYLANQDRDSDGLYDAFDNCPTNANADQLDTDGDKQGDVCDSDIDGDGISNTDEKSQGTNPLVADSDDDSDSVVNAVDNCPAAANADQLDTDGDKQGDVCDSDIDGDGLTNDEEITLGTNPVLADSDEDGISDGDEVANGTDPLATSLEVRVVNNSPSAPGFSAIHAVTFKGNTAALTVGDETKAQVDLSEGDASYSYSADITITSPFMGIHENLAFGLADRIVTDSSELGTLFKVFYYGSEGERITVDIACSMTNAMQESCSVNDGNPESKDYSGIIDTLPKTMYLHVLDCFDIDDGYYSDSSCDNLVTVPVEFK